MRLHLLLSVITAAVILYLYSLTLSPSIAGGDSGEIVAEGCHLGTAHPPGYPIMTIIVYFFSQLKIYFGHTVGYWINLFSACCTASACLLISLIVFEYSQNEVGGAIAASTLFAFSPLIWQYAVTAEVFPINTFFAALLIYLTVKFSKTQKLSYAITGAFFCGIAICDQHTILLYEVPLILWMLFLLRRKIYFQQNILLWLSIAFLTGLLPYLYMPIASLLSPKPGSWGDVASLSGFIHHFLRKDYGTFQLFSGKTGRANENMWERNIAYWKDFSEQQISTPWAYFCFIGAISAVYISRTYDLSYQIQKESIPVGFIVSKPKNKTIVSSKQALKSKKNFKSQEVQSITSSFSQEFEEVALIDERECKWTPLILIVTQLFYFVVFHSLSNLPLTDRLLYGVHQRFWMQPTVLSCVWVGIGLNSLVIFIKRFLPSSSEWGLQVIPSFILIILAIYIAIHQYHRNFYISDQSNAWYFHRYARAILEPLPKDSILLINYDQQWTSVRYLQVCEGFRSDITAIQLSMMSYKWFQTKRSLYATIPSLDGDRNRSIQFPGTYLTYFGSPQIQSEGAFHLISFLDANLENWDRHIFLGGKLGSFDIQLSQFYELVPFGLVSQFYPQTALSSFPAKAYAEEVMTSWGKVLDNLQDYFPPEDKYPEETWEWTINRDFKDRLIDAASYFLAQSINIAASDPAPLINALYYLETAYHLEGPTTAPTSLLKNLGLGHVHLIQNKILKEEQIPLPAVDVFDSLNKINWPTTGSVKWKEWSANRFTEYWGAFLKREDAALDPQYPTIKHLYDTVTAAAAAQSPQTKSSPGTDTGTSAGTSTMKSNAKKMKATKKVRKDVEKEL